MNSIEFTKHSRYRMKIREIEEWKVRETIFNPDETYIGSEGEINAIKKFGKQQIRVAYLSLPGCIKVLTVID